MPDRLRARSSGLVNPVLTAARRRTPKTCSAPGFVARMAVAPHPPGPADAESASVVSILAGLPMPEAAPCSTIATGPGVKYLLRVPSAGAKGACSFAPTPSSVSRDG